MNKMQEFKNEVFTKEYSGRNKSFKNLRYVNCFFNECDFSNSEFTNCEFENCNFQYCRFKRTFLALNNNNKSGKFIECIFVKCDLTETSFRFPIIDRCEFRDCVLKDTNFDGSIISNVKFIGTLDCCFFRGHSAFAKKKSFLLILKSNSLEYQNKMLNVDFSSSKLVGVSFTEGIDLQNCTFPSGKEYVYIENLKMTMERLLSDIEKEWTNAADKQSALNLINNFYYSTYKQNQQNDFIDSFIVEEIDREQGSSIGMKVFDAIKAIQ